MSQPTTHPTEPEPPTFADQYGAVMALAAMAEAFGHLPPAMVSIYSPSSGGALYLQVDTPAAFEAWREALRLPATAVELKTDGVEPWLAVKGAFSGAWVDLGGWGLPAAAQPRDPSGRLAEQRHQLDDPAAGGESR